MITIGARWQPGHIVRIDTAAGTFEEVNSPCDRDAEARIQRALLTPARPVVRMRDVLAVCRVGTAVVVRTGLHTAFSSNMRGTGAVYPMTWDFTDTLEACVRLGLISRADFNTHKEASDALRAARMRKEDAQMIEVYAKRLGVKLTAAQVKALEKAKKS